jgi:hypothetical protein
VTLKPNAEEPDSWLKTWALGSYQGVCAAPGEKVVEREHEEAFRRLIRFIVGRLVARFVLENFGLSP